MNTYRIAFVGRMRGAIGIFYKCEETLVAETEDQAIEMLRVEWETLGINSIEEIGQ